MAFNRAGAKAEGYTDQEIDEFLSQQGQNLQQYQPSSSQPVQSSQPYVAPSQTQPSVTPQLSKEALANLLAPKAPQPKKEGFLTGLAKGVFNQAVGLPKDIAEAGYQAYLTALPGGATQGKEQQARVKKPFLFKGNEQRLSDRGKILESVTKSTAGTAAFVPGVGYVGAGALTGFSQTKQGASLDETALNTVIGGLFGKATKTVMGKLAPGLTKAGEGLKSKIVNPKVPAGLSGAAKEKAIVQTVNKYVPGKTSVAKYENLQGGYDKLGQDISAKLAQNNPSIILKSIKSKIVSKLKTEGPINYRGGKNPDFKAATDSIVNQLDDIAQDGKVSTDGLLSFKLKLGGQLSNAFKKLSKGSELTPDEEIGLTIWKSLDDLMPAGIKELTRAQSMLFQAAEGLQKAATSKYGVGIGMFKAPVPRVLPQGLQSIVGEGLEKTGQAATNVVGKSPELAAIAGTQVLGNQNLPAIGQRFGEQPQQPSQELPAIPQTQTGALPDVSQAQWPEGFVSPEQYSQAQFDTSLTEDDRAQLKESYEAGQRIYNEQTKAVTKKDSDEFLTKAISNIDELLNLPTAGLGPLTGGKTSLSIKFLGGVGTSKEEITLNERYSLLKLNILRAYQGARISDADFKLADQYTPNIRDTEQTARAKLTVLKQILAESKPSGLPDIEQPVVNTPEDLYSKYGITP